MRKSRKKKITLWQQSLSLAAIAVLVVGSFFFYFHERVNIPGFPIGQAYTSLEVPQDVAAGKRSETHFIIPLKYDRSSSFAGWNFVSIPFTSSLPVGQALTTNTSAEFFHYDPAQGKYLTGDNVPVTAGTGYWVKVDQEGQLTIPLTPSSRQFYLSLKKGWNQIGLPTVNTLKTTDVKIKEGSTTTTYTLAQAYAHVIVGDFLFAFDSAQGKWIQISTGSTTAILSPGVGYFLYMYKDAELFVELPDLVVEKASLDKGTTKTIELSTTQSEVTGSVVQSFPPERDFALYQREKGVSVAKDFFDPTALKLEEKEEFAPGYIVEFKPSSQIAGIAALSEKVAIESVHERAKQDILSLVQQEITTKSQQAGIAAVATPTAKQIVINEYQVVFNGMAVNVDAEVAKKIEKLDYVEKVWPNRIVHALLMDTVPLIKANEAWRMNAPGKTCSGTPETCLTGKGVKVAVIDTGVDYTHPDFGSCTKDQFVAGSCAKVISGFDFVNKDNDPMDDQGHGTHVAGTIAGNGALKGIAPDASIIAYKVLDSRGSGTWIDIIAAIDRATDPNGDNNSADHFDIISLSLGGSGGDPDDPSSRAIDTAVSKGVVAVIAAGNSGPSAQTVGSPGTARKAITVGATYKKDYDSTIGRDINPRVDQITYFSSRGPVVWDNKIVNKPDIVAPGALICAARYDSIYPEGQHPFYKPCLDDKHVQMMGTSMATPVVSGVVALVKQKHPDWTPEQIKTALKNTANDLGLPATVQGMGRVDAQRAASLETALPVAAIYDIENVNGQITIRGTASGTNFKEYNIYFKKDGQEKLICKATTSVTSGILCADLNLTQLEDGVYDIVLRVTDMQGKLWQDKSTNIVVDNIKITAPVENEVVGLGGTLKIEGVILGHFDSYTIQYREGSEPSQWFDAGIQIIKPGAGDSVSGTLATWDTSNLSRDGLYMIRLSVKRGSVSFSESHRVNIDRTLHRGWPVQLTGLDEDGYFIPTLSDLDGDGKLELLFKHSQTNRDYTASQMLQVLTEDGKSKWKYGVPMWLYDDSFIGVSVGDMDNDGKKEVFSQLAIMERQTNRLENCFVGFTHTGDMLPNWPIQCPIKGFSYKWYTASEVQSTLLDINTDGALEFVVPFTYFDLIQGFLLPRSGIAILTKQGTFFQGWPKFFKDTNNKSNAEVEIDGIGAADLNNDGKTEIVALVRFGELNASSTNPFSGGGKVYIYKWDKDGNLTTLPIETASRGGFDRFGPIFVDLDGDGDLEIGFLAEKLIYTDKYGTDWSSGGRIFFYHSNGQLVDGWPIDFQKGIFQSSHLAIGDINKDGSPEIIAVGMDFDNKGMVYVYNSKGQLVPGWPQSVEGKIRAEPTIGDIDGDGYPDILITVNGQVYAWDRKGQLLTGFPKLIGIRSFSGVAIGDLDGDGKNEIVAANSHGKVYVWNTEGKADAVEWPMFRGNAQHTGVYKSKGGTPRPSPCSARPDCVIEGQEFAISATISNKGKGTLLDVSSITLSILNEKGIEIKGMATQAGSLKPDQSTVLTFSALKLSPGKYTAVVKANPSPSLDETNPNNNMYSFTFEVQPKVSSQCTDTDADTQFPDGRNYAKKGKAFLPPPLPTLQTASLADKEDFCKDTSTLVEFYCKGNEIAQEEALCKGGCTDGRCTTPEPCAGKTCPQGQKCNHVDGTCVACAANITRVILHDRVNPTDGVASGKITLLNNNVVTASTSFGALPNDGSPGQVFLSVQPPLATSIKVELTPTSGTQNVGLQEAQIFASVDSKEVKSTGLTCTAGSEYGGSYVCANALDGNTSTEWATKGNSNPYIIITSFCDTV